MSNTIATAFFVASVKIANTYNIISNEFVLIILFTIQESQFMYSST